jgi:polyphosphate kinase
MDRSMFRRIELMFPILAPTLRRRLMSDLDVYLADNSQAWELRADGEYRLVTGEPETLRAQERLLSELAESV